MFTTRTTRGIIEGIFEWQLLLLQLYNIVPKKRKTTNYEEKECTSVMYTIVYTKYIWTQVSLVTDFWMDSYKYIWQDK